MIVNNTVVIRNLSLEVDKPLSTLVPFFTVLTCL
jgi:hypothetical protein